MAAALAAHGALRWAYEFYLSTLPVRYPDEFGAGAPAWASEVADAGWAFIGLWLVMPVPLLIGGAAYLGRAPSWRWAWQAAWAGALAVAVGLIAVDDFEGRVSVPRLPLRDPQRTPID